MKRKPKLALRRTSASCEAVMVKSPYADYPIGKVCAVAGGYEYYSSPARHAARGPVKTKAKAILKVINDYKSWIGASGFEPGQVRYR
jgi:hypothetical protein